MVWCLVGGFLLGVLFMFLIGRTQNDGDLVIYVPDQPDEPMYPYCEGKKPLEVVMTQKSVKLNVVIRHLNSQK